MRRGILLLCILGLAVPSAVEAGPGKRRLSKQVDRLLAQWDQPGSPGAAVAVVRGGVVVHARGYGRANLEHDVPITTRTVFDIASVSKQFTGLALAMLVQQGKLSLDDDYRKHLPEMPDYGTVVTLDHLVHHTSGIRDWPGTLALAGWSMSDVISQRQILTMAEAQRELSFQPGEEHLYSNTNYNLLAEIVSRVSGRPFPEWTAEHLFGPLGMASTHFHDDADTLVAKRAYGYYRDEKGQLERSSDNLTALGSSSLFTTVEDLARWAANFDDPQVGGAEAIERMHQRGALANGETVDYAFGVVHGEYRGKSTVSHGGAWASFRTELLRFPEERFCVIVLSNFSGFDADGTAHRIADLYLFDGPQQEREEEGDDDAPEPPAVVEMSEEELRRFEGYYWYDEAERLRRVYVNRDGTLMYSRGGGSESPLAPVGAEEFRMLDVPVRVEVRFQILHGQRPAAMVVTVEDGEPSWMRAAERADASVASLGHYAGTYRSEELDTTYEIEVADGALLARHRRHGTIALTPTIRNRFFGDRWFFDAVRFRRNEDGRVTGFSVSNGRSRNLRFERRAAAERDPG